MATTWNPSDKDSEITLSAGNLVATCNTPPANNADVRATQGRSSGKFGFKVTGSGNGGGDSWSVGLAEASSPLTDRAGDDNSLGISFRWKNSGTTAEWFVGGASQGTITTPNTSAVYVVFDLDAQLAWAKGGSLTNWNGSGTANPDTGTGGISFSGISGALYPIAELNNSPLALTAVFNDISGAGLSNFTAWDGSTAVTGTGTEVLPGFHVAASGHLDETGTIAAALPGLVTAALGHLDETGTASALLPNFSAAATGVVGGVSGSAVAVLPGFSVAVSGTLNESGTAALALAAFHASGSGHLDETGAAALPLPGLLASGTGHLDETGTVVASLPGLTVAVSGTVGAGGPIGNISAVLPGLIAAAAGHLDEAGAVVATIPAFRAAIAATLDETGTIIAILPSFGVSGLQSRWRATANTVRVWLDASPIVSSWTKQSVSSRSWTKH